MIPIQKHYYRSHKIEFKLFPKNRKFPYSRKLFKKEYLKVLNVFLFWIFLVFVGRFSMTFLALYRDTPYIGLKVELPEAQHSTRLYSNINDLYIFIDKDNKITINEKTILTFDELNLFYETHKIKFTNFSIILLIDISANMGVVNDVLKSLRYSDLLEVHFRTR